MSVPITNGAGNSSIASDIVATQNYQQIKVVDGTIGGSTGLIVNADGTLNARISGSVATAGGTFTGSVSGTVGASIIGQLPAGNAVIGAVAASISGVVNVAGSIAAFQAGTNITSISGGVVTSISGGISSVALAGANTVSVVGTVGASIIGLTPVNVSNFPTNQNVSGSVVAFQGTNPFIVTGSVQGSFTPSGNQSVSGTVGASIIGLVPVQIPSSVAVAIISGSIAASFTPPANQSVSGVVMAQGKDAPVASITGNPVYFGGRDQNGSVIGAAFGTGREQVITGSVQGTMSVLGTVPVTQSTTPWVITGSVQGSFSPSGNQSVSGTVQTDVRGSVAVAIISGSIAATFTPPANQSVSGTVAVTQQGPWYASILIASVVGAIPVTIASVPPQSVSGTVGASIIGQLPAGTAPIGSVATLQGTNPWIVTSSVTGGLFPISGSVAATITNTNINVSGSVAAVQLGTRTTSIVGGYADNSAWTQGNVGLEVMGVRNDTLSSVTGADSRYSPMAVGPVGETVVANSPLTKWVQNKGSIFTGVIQPIIATQGSSIFTYVTGVQVANNSANNTLLTFYSGGSIIGYTYAPANGGSNITFPNALKTFANADFAGSIAGVASVFLSAQGFIAKI